MKRKIIACLLTLTMALSVVVTGVGAERKEVEALAVSKDVKKSSDLNVDYHTKDEIISFIMSHPVSEGYKTEYKKEPSTSSPYEAGRLSDKTIQSALNMLNIYRYIAGVPANVTANEEYIELAQHAALVNAVNDEMDHFPSQPKGMPDEIYELGAKGASSSNLGWNYFSLVHLIDGFVNENVSSMGHRRWCLNPTMAKTGFGQVENHYAMYSFDRNNTDAEDYNAVSWPGQITPVQYFSNFDYWSLSMGEVVNKNSVSVTMTRLSDGYVYKLKQDEFYVDNGGYGLTGCIIFKPNNIDFVQADSSVAVHIEGKYDSYNNKDDFSVDYTVEFFDLKDYLISSFVTRLYEVCLDRTPDSTGSASWVGQLKSRMITGSEAAYGFIFSPEFKGHNYCNECYVEHLYNAFMGRKSDAKGKKYWVSQLESGSTREAVFNGFVMSNEFKEICDSYGIDIGKEIEIPIHGSVPSAPCSSCGAIDGITEFVTRLYSVCLDREPDSQGLNNWRQRLATYTDTGTSVAYGFIFSSEFQNKNYDNATYVEYMYKAFFGRASDSAGKQNWVSLLENGGTRTDVFYGFTQSQEFAGLCNKYGISR